MILATVPGTTIKLSTWKQIEFGVLEYLKANIHMKFVCIPYRLENFSQNIACETQKCSISLYGILGGDGGANGTKILRAGKLRRGACKI